MKKLDRAILIFIGLGIWELAMSQFLKPSNAVAVSECGRYDNPCYVLSSINPLKVDNWFIGEKHISLSVAVTNWPKDINASLLKIQDALKTQTKIFAGWDEKKDEKMIISTSPQSIHELAI